MTRIAFTVGVSLILGLSATTMAASANDTPQPRTFSVIIELAGADESNRATKKELKESGTKMIPAAPTAQSRDPLKPIKPVAEEKPAPVVVEEKTPKPVPAETTQETTPTEKPEETKAATADTAPKAPAAAAQAEEPQKVSQPAETDDLMFRPYARIDAGFSLTGSPGGDGRNGTHQNIDVQDTGLFGVGIGMKVGDQVRLEGAAKKPLLRRFLTVVQA